jgi:hypothetical protein
MTKGIGPGEESTMLCGHRTKDLKLLGTEFIHVEWWESEYLVHSIWAKSALVWIEVIFLLKGNACVGDILDIVVVSGHGDNVFVQETFHMKIIVSLE